MLPIYTPLVLWLGFCSKRCKYDNKLLQPRIISLRRIKFQCFPPEKEGKEPNYKTLLWLIDQIRGSKGEYPGTVQISRSTHCAAVRVFKASIWQLVYSHCQSSVQHHYSTGDTEVLALVFGLFIFHSSTCGSVPMWVWCVTWDVVPSSLGVVENSMPVSVPRGSPAVPTVGLLSPWIHYR